MVNLHIVFKLNNSDTFSRGRTYIQPSVIECIQEWQQEYTLEEYPELRLMVMYPLTDDGYFESH